jgi:virginiamycin A acetyltransferase
MALQARPLLKFSRLRARLRAARIRRWRRFRSHRWKAILRRAGVEIGEDAFIAWGVAIPGGCSVGRGTSIHKKCVLRGSAPIAIGNYCAIAEGTHIASSNHDVNRPNLHKGWQRTFGDGRPLDESRGPLRIGHAVWVGAHAQILPGVSVGNGAVVAGGAVVTKDVEPFTIVAGNPANPIRKRFCDEVIDELEEVAWWDWPPEKLRSNSTFFSADLKSEGVRARELVA